MQYCRNSGMLFQTTAPVACKRWSCLFSKMSVHTADTDVLNLAHRYTDRTVPSSYKMVMSDSLVLYDLMK